MNLEEALKNLGWSDTPKPFVLNDSPLKTILDKNGLSILTNEQGERIVKALNLDVVCDVAKRYRVNDSEEDVKHAILLTAFKTADINIVRKIAEIALIYQEKPDYSRYIMEQVNVILYEKNKVVERLHKFCDIVKEYKELPGDDFLNKVSTARFNTSSLFD